MRSAVTSLLLCLLVARTADAQDGPPDALAFLAPDWMPIVTLGYHGERQWWRESRNYLIESVSGNEHTLHGLDASLLLPTLATGTARSAVRLALGVGVGIDFARRRVGSLSPRRTDDPSATIPPPITAQVLTVQVRAQLGLILRAAPRGRGFLGSLLWMPGSRHRQQSYETVLPYLRDRLRTSARGRLTLGWVHDHLHTAVYIGGARWRGGTQMAEEHVLEFGLQVGAGW